MNILDRIKILAKQKHISLAEVERRTGLSSGSITKWNKNVPSVDKLERVAKLFNVSLDYLVGGSDYANALKDFDDTVAEENSTKEFSTIQRYVQKLDQKEQNRLIKIMEATFDDLNNGNFKDDDDDDEGDYL